MKKKSVGIFSVVIVLAILFLSGTWFYHHTEGWSNVDAFYFTVMTITTVGFGDLVPTHDFSKIMTAVFSLISIPLVIFCFGVLAKGYFESRIGHIESRITELLSREKTLEEDVTEVIDEKK
ncbi:MAG: potassium channel family protein [Patescibacteria group bacterium]|jgi:hypothetical protein